jgi:hypothetical protein
MQLVKLKYLLDDWRERECDLLIRLPFKDPAGLGHLLVCILLEHQSTIDQAMPLRMLLTAVLFWQDEWQKWKSHHKRGEPLRLTPVLPVVLYTGIKEWDSNRVLADLFEVPQVWKPWLPSWPMPLWDLTKHSVAGLLASQEPLWRVLAVARAELAAADEFGDVFRDVLVQLEPLAGVSKVDWDQLVKLVLYWALYRRPDREHQGLIEAARANVHDVNLKKEIQTMTQLLEKSYEQEVFERGLARGKAEALRGTLESLLRQRFPEVPEGVRQRIATADVASLERAISQVLIIPSLGELPL